MGVERVIYCDGPGCGQEDDNATSPPRHVRTATPPPYIPSGFIETRAQENGEDFIHFFCGWDCLMKYAAAQPVPEVIHVNPDDMPPFLRGDG